MSDDKKSGPEEAIKGVVEGAKGLAKEAVGSVVGNKDLEQEGEAQQDKAQPSVTLPRKKPKPKQLGPAKQRRRSASSPTRTKQHSTGPGLTRSGPVVVLTK